MQNDAERPPTKTQKQLQRDKSTTKRHSMSTMQHKVIYKADKAE